MLALPVRRNSLCLFCACAARPAQRLLPRIQVAYRTTKSSSSRKNDTRIHRPLNDGKKFGWSRGGAAPILQVVNKTLHKLQDEFSAPTFLESLSLTRDQFTKEWASFEKAIHAWVKQDSRELHDLVQQAQRRKATLETRLRYLFYAQTCGGRFTSAELENQKQVADLRYPAEWYPATREVPRVVHMHVGPTNSGKTYHALKRLEAAESGIYLGPLRLLAHEVYTRLNSMGRSCALVTGEEQRVPEAEGGALPPMFSCTVEMAPLNTKFDVAVIDEIQMINHPERGWAWTQAFLGLQAREIHLCGEARTVNLMRELCALVGDECHVHTYERLTPLAVQPRSLGGKLSKLQKGDCLVAFTVIGIHALRREIEQRTKKKCAIVYGSLPPETRAQQAKLFNDPDNDYDYLVASDAIGMGLNLAIKRVIFESTMKSNGTQYIPLPMSDIKQIAGRAGRYKTAADAVSDNAVQKDGKTMVMEKKEKTVGWCTTLDEADLPALQAGMEAEPEQIKTAGIFPPSLIVERFAGYFPPGTPFSYILLRLHEISEIHPRFQLCALKEQLAIADAIHTVKGLSIQDRIVITSAPCNMRDKGEKEFLRTLAACIAEGRSASLLDLPNLPLNSMDEPPRGDREYLYTLEVLHKQIVLYLWLSYRFPNVFVTRSLAIYTKKLLEDQIEHTLTEYSHSELLRRKAELREQARKEAASKKAASRMKAAAAVDSLEGKTPAPPGMPAEAEDILNDNRAFAEGSPATDDVGVYPEEALEESEEREVPSETAKSEQRRSVML